MVHPCTHLAIYLYAAAPRQYRNLRHDFSIPDFFVRRFRSQLSREQHKEMRVPTYLRSRTRPYIASCMYMWTCLAKPCSPAGQLPPPPPPPPLPACPIIIYSYPLLPHFTLAPQFYPHLWAVSRGSPGRVSAQHVRAAAYVRRRKISLGFRPKERKKEIEEALAEAKVNLEGEEASLCSVVAKVYTLLPSNST